MAPLLAVIGRLVASGGAAVARGAIAAEGAAATATAAEGSALAASGGLRGAALLGGGGATEAGGSTIMRKVLSSNLGNKIVDGGMNKIFNSDHHKTLEKISQLYTPRDESDPRAINDNSTFGTSPSIISPQNNIVSKLLGSNDNSPIDRDEATGVTLVASLAPILESIDRNTRQIADQTVEISSKIEKILADNSVQDLRYKEASLEQASASDMITGNDNAQALSPLDQAKEEKKDGIVGGLMKMLTGGLTAGAGSLITNLTGTQEVQTTGGGYGGGNDSAARVERANPNTKSQRSKYQMQIYDSFKKQGMTHEGAMTMVAQVGRENSFNPNNLFGTHVDPHNKKINAGMISWQGDRARNLLKFMKEKGLLDKNGKIISGQASLDAQAEFLVREMGGDKKMAPVLASLKDPTKKYEDLEAGVGDKVIKWRRNDPRYRASGYRNQNQAFSEINELTGNQRGVGRSQDANWGGNKEFDPIRMVRDRFGDSASPTSGYRSQEHQDRLVKQGLTKTRHSHHTTGDAVDFLTPNGMSKKAFMEELKKMFPEAKMVESNGRAVHVTFKGWGGAPAIKDGKAVARDGRGAAISAESAKARAGQQQVVVREVPVKAAVQHAQRQEKKRPAAARQQSYVSSWAKYFGL